MWCEGERNRRRRPCVRRYMKSQARRSTPPFIHKELPPELPSAEPCKRGKLDILRERVEAAQRRHALELSRFDKKYRGYEAADKALLGDAERELAASRRALEAWQAKLEPEKAAVEKEEKVFWQRNDPPPSRKRSAPAFDAAGYYKKRASILREQELFMRRWQAQQLRQLEEEDAKWRQWGFMRLGAFSFQ